MSTVLIKNFSEDGTTLDWARNANSDTNIVIGNLTHGKDVEDNDDKTSLVVEDTVDNIKSFYPMSGGPIAQELHQHHLEAHTLGEVQADATTRNISTSGKTQAELIVEIIQDECNQKRVLYLL